ncbi:hypothetical protein E7T06_11910 [Deinococcus sp. Arct2-2]|uniref:hypothetical protein n=1 Tax=Deinococcus sp. Arct2-2 TaxID=2568653 RepID=UPI0010A544BD|nr:hypothetical protein [Deinococcus sp. Arct2-2]THF69400.1 hypothetical protein E7T06_11910 [Deinococcus sp. Arct2-2]
MLSHSLALAAALTLLAPALGGCRYNFVPLIPPEVKVDFPARITGATLTRSGEVLTLQASLDGRFDPDYLSVVWFDGGRELGRDSVYLDAETRKATFALTAPTQGAYRALLSFSGNVLRQLELYEVQP